MPVKDHKLTIRRIGPRLKNERNYSRKVDNSVFIVSEASAEQKINIRGTHSKPKDDYGEMYRMKVFKELLDFSVFRFSKLYM